MHPSLKETFVRQPLDLWYRWIDLKEDIDLLLEIERSCFPENLQATRSSFRDILKDPFYFGMVLLHKKETIGYALGTILFNSPYAPSEKSLGFKISQQQTEHTFYLSNVSILKPYRSQKALDFLMHEMAAEVKIQGYQFVTAHGRKVTGFSRVIQRRYGGKLLKSYKNWQGYGEPFDYIQVELAKIPTLPPLQRHFYKGVRKLLRLFY